MRAPIFLALALAAIACTSSGAPAPRPGDQPPVVRVIGRNLSLFPGPERAVRIAFEPAEPVAQLIATFTPDTARVTVCPVADLAAEVDPSTCRIDVRSGVRGDVRAPGMRALAIELEGADSVPLDIVLEYGEGGRGFGARIPRIPGPPGDRSCADNACNPFFELQPTRAGPFAARATWSGPEATMVLLEGRVLARSETSTGIPYAEEARADGASPLSISGRMSGGDEFALAFRHRARGPEPLLGVQIEATWP